MSDELIYTIAVDPERRQVGCVMIQRLLGASIPIELLSRFDWRTDSLEGMRVLPITEPQVEALLAHDFGRRP